MKRTGKKELEFETNHVKLYRRGYECPKCGFSDVYSEYLNAYAKDFEAANAKPETPPENQ